MKERYHLLDGIRGLAVVGMVLFHFSYDMFMICGLDTGWYWRPEIRLWQILGCCTFILLSGLCWHLGRKRVKNGLILNGFGLLVTAVTVIAMPSQAVWFGVLNCLGCCLLLATLFEPVLRKIPWQAGGILCFLVFLLTYHVDQGFIGIGQFVGYIRWKNGDSLFGSYHHQDTFRVTGTKQDIRLITGKFIKVQKLFVAVRLTGTGW